MKLTRERKIVGAVFGLALAAFCVDRLMPSSIDEAAAGNATQDSSALLLASGTSANHLASATNTTTSGTTSATASAMISEGSSLAKRLAAVASQTAKNDSAARDVFRVSSKWSADSAAAHASTARQVADAFIQTHKLTAISRGAANGVAVAIVDGKLLHVGTTFDGYKLTSITKSAATFESDGSRVRLTLKSEGVR